MRIGFILYDYFPFGGLQRDCRRTAEVCAERGHEVVIFTRSWRGSLAHKAMVRILGRRGLTNEGLNRRFLAQLKRELPTFGLDGVVGFNRMHGLDVYFAGDPCYQAKIAQLRSKAWRRLMPRYHHFKRLETAVFARGQKTHILLLTDHEVPLYQRYYDTEPERFHLLPPGIEQRDSPTEKQQSIRKRIRSEYGWTEEDTLMLMVGSDFTRKGLDRVIHCLAALPPDIRERCQLGVIGEDHSSPFLRQAQRLGVAEAVHFFGGRTDVYDFLLAADVLVHPARSEAAGMVLLEALTAGLPVVATAACGYAFHIKRAEAGIVLASPFRQEDFDQSLASMVSDAAAQAMRRRKALNYAAREDLYSCHQKAADIIEKVIGERSARRVPKKETL